MGLPLSQRHPTSPLGRRLVYDVCRGALRLPLRTVLPLTTVDIHNVPEQGPLLIIANHQSYLDPPIVGTMFDRHLDFIARSGLFKNERFGRLIDMLNAIPIREEGGDLAAMKEALRRLEAGSAVLVFPEGSRSHDGSIGTFKRGIAVMLKRAQCPVLPVAIEGAFDAWPRSRRTPKWGVPIAVKYGRALSHEEVMADGPEAGLARLRDQIDVMRLELRALLREKSGGRYPAPGPGDGPASDPERVDAAAVA